MRKVQLSDVCDISSGGTPSRSNVEFFNGDIPWAKISDIENAENGVIYSTEEHISKEGLKNIRGKLFPKGTLLFSMYGSIGKVAIAGKELSTNQAILGIRPKSDEQVNLNFLKCWFESNKHSLINQGRGVALKNLSATIVRNLTVELPPLDDQIRIAHLLGKVEGLIAQRKQHLQQLDELLKGVFLEMFGPSSPGYNTWPLEEIRDLAAKHKGAMRTGPFGSNLLHSEFTAEGDVAVLGIDNAVQNRFAWDERRFITNEKYRELESYRVYPGDVIVTIMGTIGRSAVVPSNIPLAINTKHLAAITLNREIANPLFLSYSIHSSPFILNQFRSKNRGAIMSGLNLGIIKETKLKRPPIELQNQFADTHMRVDEMKSMYLQSLTDLESLYGALSQQAFKGELDLSRVPLPDEQGQPTRGEHDEQQEQADRSLLPVGAITPTEVINHLVQAAQPQGRAALLGRWLRQYLTNTSIDASLGSAQFLESAWQMLQEAQLETEGETPALTLDDYDVLKDLVFKALASGELNQAFDGDSNRVALQKRPANCGTW